MSEKIATELGNWFLTLGFQDKNLSTDQIEAEFRRLSPPELRDTWRSIMMHVVPVKEARYIRKVLMLNELNKYKATRKKKILIGKNIRNVHDFEQFKSCDDVYRSLDQCHKNVVKFETEISSLKTKVTEKELEHTELLKKKEKLDHMHIIIDLKLSDREKTIRELTEMHTYFNYFDSFWQAEKNNREGVMKDLLEIVKDCLRNVNEFVKQQNILPETDLIKEKESLMNNIIRLTSKLPVSNLYKSVIDMLKDTLSALLKLSDYVNSKQDADSSWLANSKLTELKKECVQYFLKNAKRREHLEKLQDKVLTDKSELLDLFSDNNCMGFQRETLKAWLDSECQKQCMLTREKHLRKEFNGIKNRANDIVDFSNNDEKLAFFANMTDSSNPVSLLEQEVTNNICHLSDEPINMFIKCQTYCINRLELFIKKEQSEKTVNFDGSSSQRLSEELVELKQLDLQLILKNIVVSGIHETDELPDYRISVCTEQCYYLIYLTNVYKNLAEKFCQSTTKPESLRNKSTKIKNDQEKFKSLLRKSVWEAKSNLNSVEKYAAECSKNIELWIQLSGNDIIPKGMMVADRQFIDWLRRYDSAIQCLRKKTNKTFHARIV